MEDRKENQDKPDVEVQAAAAFKYMYAKKSGKVKIRFYSNHKDHRFHESYRVNLPEELQDGETYTDGAIRMRVENSIRKDPDEFDMS